MAVYLYTYGYVKEPQTLQKSILKRIITIFSWIAKEFATPVVYHQWHFQFDVLNPKSQSLEYTNYNALRNFWVSFRRIFCNNQSNHTDWKSRDYKYNTQSSYSHHFLFGIIKAFSNIIDRLVFSNRIFLLASLLRVERPLFRRISKTVF